MTKKPDSEIVKVNVKKIQMVMGAITVALSVLGSVLGTGITVGSANAKIAAAEQRIQEHIQTNTTEFQQVDAKLRTSDERWADFQKRMTAVSEDVAVIKAIMPRLESGIKDVQAELRQRLPAVNPREGQPQQGQ